MRAGRWGPKRFPQHSPKAATRSRRVIEPFLLQQGLIQRTPRGRMLAQKAWTHLGLAAPKVTGDLFGK